MDNIIFNRIRENWLKASQDFNFEIISPFIIEINGDFKPGNIYNSDGDLDSIVKPNDRSSYNLTYELKRFEKSVAKVKFYATETGVDHMVTIIGIEFYSDSYKILISDPANGLTSSNDIWDFSDYFIFRPK